jgi:hypothetical protein
VHERVSEYKSIKGTLIPVKLTIYKLNRDKTKKLIADETYVTNGTYGGTRDYIGRSIGWFSKLDTGIYHIKLETVEDFAFLGDREVYLEIKQSKAK